MSLFHEIVHWINDKCKLLAVSSVRNRLSGAIGIALVSDATPKGTSEGEDGDLEVVETVVEAVPIEPIENEEKIWKVIDLSIRISRAMKTDPEHKYIYLKLQFEEY